MSNTAKQNLTAEAWASKLKAYFSSYEGAIIAYSGGVDSSLLAYVAHLTLEDNMLAALAARQRSESTGLCCTRGTNKKQNNQKKHKKTQRNTYVFIVFWLAGRAAGKGRRFEMCEG